MKKVLLAVVSMLLLVGVAEAQTVIGRDCVISWNANTESDLAGYRVYGTQNGVLKTVDITKPSTNTTCAALGTQAGGSLSVQVDAVDVSGNRSLKSVPAVVVNQVLPDLTAPAAPTGLTVTPNP